MNCEDLLKLLLESRYQTNKRTVVYLQKSDPLFICMLLEFNSGIQCPVKILIDDDVSYSNIN
jgi:hypothetical protein